MKTTYSVTQAQSKLPGLLKSVNENAATYGITVHDDVKAYLIGKERMDSIMETLEILSNPDAAKALRDYESAA
jgi:antitoxin YefM